MKLKKTQRTKQLHLLCDSEGLERESREWKMYMWGKNENWNLFGGKFKLKLHEFLVFATYLPIEKTVTKLPGNVLGCKVYHDIKTFNDDHKSVKSKQQQQKQDEVQMENNTHAFVFIMKMTSFAQFPAFA